jgi:8-oxo-dGTP pyrophosphatase MutT (NUDIX family)
MIKPWPLKVSTPLANYRIFTVRTDLKTSPRTGRDHDFYIIESVDWVNIIALTPANELVMVEQFRHGTNSVELEIPGGIMDASDPSPVATGIRELREETGYEGTSARCLGTAAANPAIMNNFCHFILIGGCELRHPIEFDHGEDIVTRLVPVAEVPGLVAKGLIRHPLVVAALYHFELSQRLHP